MVSLHCFGSSSVEVFALAPVLLATSSLWLPDSNQFFLEETLKMFNMPQFIFEHEESNAKLQQ